MLHEQVTDWVRPPDWPVDVIGHGKSDTSASASGIRQHGAIRCGRTEPILLPKSSKLRGPSFNLSV